MPQTTVETVVAQARAAQVQFETASQEVVDELIVGLAWAVIEPKLTVHLRNRQFLRQVSVMSKTKLLRITVKHWGSCGI